MAAIVSPQLKALRDYRTKLPGHRKGTGTHLSTLIRFCTSGKRTASGRLVKLRAVRLGSRWLTTDEWFDEFIAAFVAEADGPAPSAPTSAPRTSAASAQLDAIGIR